MNEKQFDLVLDLMNHNPASPANVAARMVLFGGASSMASAAREVGMTRAGVRNTIVKLEKADQRIRDAYLGSGNAPEKYILYVNEAMKQGSEIKTFDDWLES